MPEQIEEVREVIQAFQNHYLCARNDYNASIIRSILKDIANAAAPKPRPLDDVLFEGIAKGGSDWLDGPLRIEYHYKDDNCVVTHIASIVPKLQRHLEREGYRIVHESELS